MGTRTPDARTIVVDLLRAAAPERSAELSDFFNRYDPEIRLTGDGPAEMKAGSERIAFSDSMLDVVWLYSFSAWSAIETYSPAIVASALTGMTVEEVLRQDTGLGQLEQDYKARMSIAGSYAAPASAAGRVWPADVPRPTADRDSLNTQGKAAFDLASIALAGIFLHELRHVRFASEDGRPDDLAEEEMACDVFARSLLTDKVGSYCTVSGEAFELVMGKRAMGLAMSSIAIHGLTPAFGRWGTSAYPSIGHRLEALIGSVPVDHGAPFWLVAASLLTGVMRQDHRPVDLQCSDFRQLTNDLVDRLK